MILRQIFSIGVILGIVATFATLYYRRPDFSFTVWSGRPLVSVLLAVCGLSLILAICLATPIEPVEISAIFNVILLLWGCILFVFGGLSHFYDPTFFPASHKTRPQPFFVRKIGIVYLALGLQCILVAVNHCGELPLVVQLVVHGWGTAALYLYRAYYGLPDEESLNENESTESPDQENSSSNSNRPVPLQHTLPDREVSLRTVEFYFNVTIPILFLTLYTCGEDV